MKRKKRGIEKCIEQDGRDPAPPSVRARFLLPLPSSSPFVLARPALLTSSFFRGASDDEESLSLSLEEEEDDEPDDEESLSLSLSLSLPEELLSESLSLSEEEESESLLLSLSLAAEADAAGAAAAAGATTSAVGGAKWRGGRGERRRRVVRCVTRRRGW